MIRAIEIETTTVCNWACKFCPVSTEPKAPNSMPMELFTHILDKVVAYGTIGVVSLNSYNEPTIDPLFMARCAELKKRGLRLMLHTNGSGLTQKKIDALFDMGIVHEITFNLPSLDEKTFTALTAYQKHSRIVETIDATIAKGFRKVSIVVNGTQEQFEQNFPAIKAKYADHLMINAYNKPKPGSITNDRCGVLDNEYSLGWHTSEPRLSGCPVPDEWLYVSFLGDLFLCCQDYHQRSVFANIRDGSLEALLRSPAYLLLLDWVNGRKIAPANFICRDCVLMCCKA